MTWYWDQATQIDVVGLRGDGWTDLGECRWGAVRSAGGMLAELEERVAAYPNTRQATIGRRIFTRRRMTPARGAPVRSTWHCLEDLYESGRRKR